MKATMKRCERCGCGEILIAGESHSHVTREDCVREIEQALELGNLPLDKIPAGFEEVSLPVRTSVSRIEAGRRTETTYCSYCHSDPCGCEELSLIRTEENTNETR